jgi:hypothetical protein
MESKFMPGIPNEERESYLKSQCYSHEESIHYRPLSSDEVAASKDSFIDNCDKINKIKDEAKEVMKAFKERIEELEEENHTFMLSVKTKSAEMKEILYGVDDQESGMMHFYNASGDLIKSRRLLPEETQTKIKGGTGLRIAANDM